MGNSACWGRALRALVICGGVLLGGVVSSIARGATVASAIFGSNMLLQRGTTVPIFGTATAGTAVTVQFQNQNKTANADADGRWRVNLDAMTASTAPSAMTVTSAGSPQITFSGVQV